MIKTDIIERIKEIIPKENIKLNEPMSKHTSFKIGGPAEVFIKIQKIEELKKIILLSKEADIKLTIVGNGSNILVKDNGIKGIVAKIDMKNIVIDKLENDLVEVTVDSGTLLGFLAQILLKREVQGFEELSGIPGTIGGAIVMNAGAHGKEMKDVVKEVTIIDYEGQIHNFNNEEAKFGYRHSVFSSGKYIILQAKLLLRKGKKEEIKYKIDEYSKYRKEKQPIEFASGGSTFKRGEDYITAKLIDETGLKGYSIGGAQISTKHAGFIINKGNATAKDILDLARYTADKVYEKYGKKIELEIKVIGE